MQMQSIDSHARHLFQSEAEIPIPAAGQVLIQVAYAGLNRADLLQVSGHYPLPDAPYFVPGLEVSGVVAAVGGGVTEWQLGDRVAALLEQGGYAEYVLANAALLLPVPDEMSLMQAAALPEALATCWYALDWLAEMNPGETLLIHAGASGIGTIAIQLGSLFGLRVIATAGSEEKTHYCRELGAIAINYQGLDANALKETIQTQAGDTGIDMILDVLGGQYTLMHLELLNNKGRLMSLAYLQGAKAEINIAHILMKNLRWYGMTLRSQPLSIKADIMRELAELVWPLVIQGEITPQIDSVYALSEATAAHEHMRSRAHKGKILLEVASL